MSDADAPVARPGEIAARDKLHAALKANYARTTAAGVALAKLAAQANAEPDLVLHYTATARVIVALEDLAKAAELAAKDLRAALQNSMQDTGCPQVASNDYTIYLAKEPAFLEITEPMRVPQDLWTKPKSEPDRAAVKAAINAGRDVPGASMSIRNSQRLVIRGKSQ